MVLLDAMEGRVLGTWVGLQVPDLALVSASFKTAGAVLVGSCNEWAVWSVLAIYLLQLSGEDLNANGSMQIEWIR